MNDKEAVPQQTPEPEPEPADPDLSSVVELAEESSTTSE